MLNLKSFASILFGLTASVGATQVMAFDGQLAVYSKMGDCNVRARIYENKSADVTILTPGDPTAGGALWLNGTIISHTPISVQNIEACGFSNVHSLTQTGASGTFETDDLMSFQFAGEYRGVPVGFHAALSGETNTSAVFTYAYYETPTTGMGNLAQR